MGQNYQDKNGGLHFLSESDIANGGEEMLPEGCVAITQEQADVARQPTAQDLANEKNAVLSIFRSLRSAACDALGSIAGRLQRAGDMNSALALDVAAQALLDIPENPAVVAAADAESTQAAILAQYRAIAAAVLEAAPAAAAEFAKLELTI